MPPVPKKKMSSQRSGKRRAQIRKDAQVSLTVNIVTCKHCGAKKELHTICQNCGK